MHQSRENNRRTFITHRQAAEVLQPGVGALNNPAMLVTPQLAAVLMGRFAVVLACGNNRLHTTLHQLLAYSVAVVALVSNQMFWLSLQPCLFKLLERGFEQFDLAGGRRLHVNSERSTLAIGQYHELCSLATLGFADGRAPFLGGPHPP